MGMSLFSISFVVSISLWIIWVQPESSLGLPPEISPRWSVCWPSKQHIRSSTYRACCYNEFITVKRIRVFTHFFSGHKLPAVQLALMDFVRSPARQDRCHDAIRKAWSSTESWLSWRKNTCCRWIACTCTSHFWFRQQLNCLKKMLEFFSHVFNVDGLELFWK